MSEPATTSSGATSSTRRWLGYVLGVARALAAIICVVALFALIDVALHGKDATFWSKQNLQTISVQNAFVAICSLGMLLIMISGGIDLSAGVALALCACVVAWGMREDVGFLIAHGQNVPGAVRNLRTAEERLRTTQRKNDVTKVDTARAEFDHCRNRLEELLKIKRDQLDAGRDSLERRRQAATDRLASLQSKAGSNTTDKQEGTLFKSEITEAQSLFDDTNFHLKSLQNDLAEVDSAVEKLHDPVTTIEADPTWLHALPNADSSSWLALFMGLGCGMLCGLLNGLLIVVLRVVPFIATLGTMTIYLGLAKLVADETAVRPIPTTQVPEWLGELAAVRPDPSWLLVSKGVWLAFILAAIMACILRYTVFGRHVFAVGSNEATARLCGINVPFVKIAVYTIAGLLVGIASICFFVRLNSGNPTSGTGLELKFIAAVVIGGGSLSGGRGTVLGTLVGTAIMGVIASGCTLLDLRNPVQDIILGAIIIAAVTIDQLRHRNN
jgi:ribose/xylose/arabinose/galactoside ABC-type transport system permease subunit